MILSPHALEEENEEQGVEPIYDLYHRIACIYALSQAASFFALDFMSLTHRGFKKNCQRCFRPDGVCKVAPWVILAFKTTLMVLTLCLSQLDDLTTLSIYGCLLVFCQVFMRTFWLKYFPITVDQMELAIHHDSASIRSQQPRWPNVTEPGNEGDQQPRWPNVTEPGNTGDK